MRIVLKIFDLQHSRDTNRLITIEYLDRSETNDRKKRIMEGTLVSSHSISYVCTTVSQSHFPQLRDF
jgi:hypothetical protein